MEDIDQKSLSNVSDDERVQENRDLEALIVGNDTGASVPFMTRIAQLNNPENLARLESQLALIPVCMFPLYNLLAAMTAGGANVAVQSLYGKPDSELNTWKQYEESQYWAAAGATLVGAGTVFAFTGLISNALENMIKVQELKKIGIDYNSLTAEEKQKLGKYAPIPMSSAFRAISLKVYPMILMAFGSFILSSEALNTFGNERNLDMTQMSTPTVATSIASAIPPIVAVLALSSEKIFNLPTSRMGIAQMFFAILGFGIFGSVPGNPYDSIGKKITSQALRSTGLAFIPPAAQLVYEGAEWVWGKSHSMFRRGESQPLVEVHRVANENLEAATPKLYKGVWHAALEPIKDKIVSTYRRLRPGNYESI